MLPPTHWQIWPLLSSHVFIGISNNGLVNNSAVDTGGSKQQEQQNKNVQLVVVVGNFKHFTQVD